MKKVLLASMIAMSTMFGVTGCATNYFGQQQQMPVVVNNGTVLAVQHYQTSQNNPSMIGGLIGSVGGAAIGSVMGAGTGKIATMMAGGLLGTLLGGQVGSTTTYTDMVNMSINLDSGQTITLSYQDKGWRVGQRVTVQQQGGQYLIYPIN